MSEQLAGGKLLLDQPAEAVARIRISNPERRNALDHEILDALAETLPAARPRNRDPLRADHRRAAGLLRRLRHRSIPTETFERDAEALVAHPFHDAIEALAAHPWPTVAAINGHCLGGGLELAITCDLRICAAGARSSACRRPSSASIYGHTGLRKFLDAVGLARTKELFLTGRNFERRARRADRPGPRGRRRRRASRRPRWRSPRGSPPTRRSRCGATSARSRCSTRNPVLSEQQESELIALRESCFASEDLREGIAAFAEKRKPNWKGR